MLRARPVRHRWPMAWLPAVVSLPLLSSIVALSISLTFFTGLAIAQEAPKSKGPAPLKTTLVDPREMGLEIEPGSVRIGRGENVTTTDADGQSVVAKLHVAIGKSAVVLLPDGTLAARQPDQFAPTDRPFAPLEKKLLAEQLLRDEVPGFKAKETRHYLYLYNTSEEFAEATSRILETMLPGVIAHAEQHHLTVHEPGLPMVVLMFKTEDEFQKYRRMPEGVVAYYHSLTNRVCMYEQSRLAQIRPDLAIQQSISTIAHEGAHQVLHNIGVQQRLSVWPMWISEGIAEYFAPTQTGARLKWKGAGQVNDMRMLELEQYLKSRGAGPADGKMIGQTVLAARLTSTGYASAWSLTHYLAKNKRTEFGKLLRELSQLSPLETLGEIQTPGICRENLDQFQQIFGDDLADTETRLVAHLKKQPYTDPLANLPHFVAMVQSGEGRLMRRSANTFHQRAFAEKWIGDIITGLPEKVRASARSNLQMFANRAQAEAAARSYLSGR